MAAASFVEVRIPRNRGNRLGSTVVSLGERSLAAHFARPQRPERVHGSTFSRLRYDEAADYAADIRARYPKWPGRNRQALRPGSGSRDGTGSVLLSRYHDPARSGSTVSDSGDRSTVAFDRALRGCRPDRAEIAQPGGGRSGESRWPGPARPAQGVRQCRPHGLREHRERRRLQTVTRLVQHLFQRAAAAALATAQEHQHAIGFLDMVSDADTMLFFSVFYRSWARSWDILPAFRAAGRRQWTGQPSAQNTQRSGVVLWSRRTLIEATGTDAVGQARPPSQACPSPSQACPSPCPSREEVATPDDLLLHIALVQDKAALGGVRNVLSTSMNYSLLHNDRSAVPHLHHREAQGRQTPTPGNRGCARSRYRGVPLSVLRNPARRNLHT